MTCGTTGSPSTHFYELYLTCKWTLPTSKMGRFSPLGSGRKHAVPGMPIPSFGDGAFNSSSISRAMLVLFLFFASLQARATVEAHPHPARADPAFTPEIAHHHPDAK